MKLNYRITRRIQESGNMAQRQNALILYLSLSRFLSYSHLLGAMTFPRVLSGGNFYYFLTKFDQKLHQEYRIEDGQWKPFLECIARRVFVMFSLELGVIR